jgi:hypothetical protein
MVALEGHEAVPAAREDPTRVAEAAAEALPLA